MAIYMSEKDQKSASELIDEYLYIITHEEESIYNKKRCDDIMQHLFSNFFDKIINGIIHNNKYRFYRFAEIDDLVQEGRLAIMLSIRKRQWDPKRGSMFNFFSTVVSKNLMNYTKKQSKTSTNENITIDNIYNHPSIKYTQNYNNNILVNDAFNALREFFDGKKKFEELTELLIHYYSINGNEKFIKKNFIAFAKAHNFSPASVNNFFANIKKMKLKKEIRFLLEIHE